MSASLVFFGMLEGGGASDSCDRKTASDRIREPETEGEGGEGECG